MPLGDRILQPIWLRTWAHPQLHLLLKKRHEWWRRLRHQPHQVVVWLSLTDPYSYLLVQTLPQFAASCELRFIFKFLPYQEPTPYFSYYLRDAWHLAQLHQLQFHHFHAPSQEHCFTASRLLLANRHLPLTEFLALVKQVFLCLWEHQYQKLSTLLLCFKQLSASTTHQQLHQADVLFTSSAAQRPACLYYQGNWFYGVEELPLLSQCLNSHTTSHSQANFVCDSASHHTTQGFLINEPQQLAYIRAQKYDLDYYFSFDDPLSYIYLAATAQLCDYYQIKLHLKPIAANTAFFSREYSHFERLQQQALSYNLQLNRHYILSEQGLSHCFALFYAAMQQEKSLEISLLLFEAIWKNSQDVSYLPHLQTVAKALCLTNSTLNLYLKNAQWQSYLYKNTTAWQTLDLPCLPSFYLQGERHICACGAYRLWAIEMALTDDIKEMPKPNHINTQLS